MRHGRSATPLNPKLQQALSCLDLRLEDELTRYRRQRAGLSVAPIVLRPKQPQKKPLELAAATDTEAPALPQAPPKAISFDLGTSSMSDQSIAAADTDESAMIPYEPETAGAALFEIANPGEQAPAEDYLESSEQLLKSLKREEAKVEVERGFLQSLSTPLGIGSMLTLLLSSAMLGYVIMNPSALSGIAQKTTQPETTETSAPQETASNSLPTSPRLDRDEFSDLGLDTLTALRTKPSPAAIAPSPSPSPTVSPAAPSAIVAPAASPSPAPVTSSSMLLPSVTVPKTSNPSPPTAAESLQYKVEIPFTGDQSLATARQVVPDAFVRSDGKIQLAATLSEEAAQKKVQELKNRGLTAEIRKPH
ncbi:hypothetical protein [Leptolyngbya sp. FACHB-17]|uniref:hypothetical protein n=1 Tax=unclassified Leptolyngbya TaxID=2650499 RepID=UPI0016805091|nr:hypothetical protein [Leptolyngbya sp. FACHB-17]MBD2081606.1 hypothetical protein [Leptolyngbya sp. FACHB-17]